MSRKCIACKEAATVFIAGGMDPDINGIPACEECKDEIKQDLLLIISPYMEEYDYDWFEDKYKLKEK